MVLERTEVFNGHDIRFEKDKDGSWVVNINDVCRALEIDIDEALDLLTWNRSFDSPQKEYYNGVYISEEDVYQLIFMSHSNDANRLKYWTASVLKRLRAQIGLHGYEVMKMLDIETQDRIDRWLDTIFYDDETKKLYKSVTVAGGDVEQVEIENFFVEDN